MQTLDLSAQNIIEETVAAYKNHHNPSLARLLKLSGLDTVEWEGSGAVLKDVKGNEYIDCVGGYGVFAVGHRHPKVVAAVKKQLDRLPLSSKVLFNRPLGNLCKKLAEVTPGNLQYSFIANSGTEAVEGALKLVRLSTGKRQVIHAENAFHGKTFGSLSASGRPQYKEPFEPLVPEFIQVPFNNVEAIEKAITSQTAAVILEPVQGEGGIQIPSKDYLKKVREICTRKQILMVLDEVQTGFGRTGAWFACQHSGIVPDVLILAKALGGGVMPIGAFVGTAQVWEAFKTNPLIHTSTFGGNPLACAAALAAIKVLQEEKLPERAATLGSTWLEQLKPLATQFPEVVKEVRGLGFMIGIELQDPKFGGYIIPEMTKHHVLVAYTLNQSKVIRLEPPLVTTQEQLQTVTGAFRESVEKAGKFFHQERQNAIH